MKLTAVQLEQFDRDGYLFFPRQFSGLFPSRYTRNSLPTLVCDSTPLP